MATGLMVLFFKYVVFACGVHAAGVGPETRLPLILVGTVIRASGANSFATVRLRGVDRRGNYFVGGRVQGQADVISVARDLVVVRNLSTGSLEHLSIGRYEASSAVTQAALVASSDAPKEFHVRKSVVDRALGNLPSVLQDATVVPFLGASGKIEGFKLVDVRAGSIFEKELGLRKGDLLKRVNGVVIDSPATAVELFTQLRDSSLIQLEFERDGRPVSATYLVRD